MILTDIVTFLGRFHPLIVHLPIGILLLSIIFDGVSYFKQYEHLRRAIPFTLLLGFIAALASSVLGYLLSLTGEYDPQTLNDHRTAGILLTLLAGSLYALTTEAVKNLIPVPRLLFSGLAGTLFLLVVYAGHQGNNLTRGTDYISMETLLRQEREKPTQPGEAMIFEDIVHPILERRCAGCHNDNKRKGRLSMKTRAALLKGGKTGPAIVPGNLRESELFLRITLDPAHEDFMPTDGKPPLSGTETDIIRWWIEKGMAADEKKISELQDHQEVMPLIATQLQLNGFSAEAMNVLRNETINPNIPDTLDITVVEDLRKKGLVVRVMFNRPVMLDVTLPARPQRSMSEIENELSAIAKNIIWLNLSNNNFSEKDLECLRLMTNVEKLRLEKNPISDGISEHLRELKFLEAVNLNETQVGPEFLNSLKGHPSIKRIYTWRTRADTL